MAYASKPNFRHTRSRGDGATNGENEQVGKQTKQVGSLIATVETGDRITCLSAFVMDRSGSNADLNGPDEQPGAIEEASESEGESEDGN